MNFKVKSKRGSCRSGEVFINNVPFDTPMCVMYTRAGTIPHIAIWHDLLEYNYQSPIQLTLPTLVDQPNIELVKKLDTGIHSFIGCKNPCLLTIQDPATEPPIGYNEEKAISVWAAGGRRKIDVQQFLSIVEAFKPNVVECLCDTIPSSGQSVKRIKKSVDRTLKFLDEIVKNNKESECSLLGAIEGSDSLEERLRSAKETAKHPVSGFMLEGFSGSCGDWPNLLDKTTSVLPEDKPRFIQGIGSPDDVIKAVECGVDIFDSSFPYQATERGCALIFPSRNKKFKSDRQEDARTDTSLKETTDTSIAGDGKNAVYNENEYEINLNDPRFSNDLNSVDRCTCYCCISHSRAYIYHLLVTKEMLAQVLLMTHNFHQYYIFFEDIRQAISNDNWEDFKDRFNGRNC